MSGVLQPKLRSIRGRVPLDVHVDVDADASVEDAPTKTTIRRAPAYANDGPDTLPPVVEPEPDGDDKSEPITWVRGRHPRVQH